MAKSGALTVTARGDREIVMTRTFNAPRRLVWEAYTKPELLKKWLLGPDGWYFITCEVDLRVGGKYRYVWKNDEKNQTLGMGGEYREIAAPGRLVCTEKFDDFPGEAINTLEHVRRVLQCGMHKAQCTRLNAQGSRLNAQGSRHNAQRGNGGSGGG